MSLHSHTSADDLVFDLVSNHHHALKAATTYARYEQDADGHREVQAFFQQCAEQDAHRARRCHELLGVIAAGTGLSS